MAASFAVLFVQGATIATGLILFCLVALLFFDLRYQMLPDTLIGVLALAGLWRLGLQGIFAAVGIGAFFGLLYFVSKGQWLGFGDVKLGCAMGLVFGYPLAVSTTLLAIWAGAAVGVVLILTHKAHRKTALPFGSFWAAAALLGILWPASISWISRLFILPI